MAAVLLMVVAHKGVLGENAVWVVVVVMVMAAVLALGGGAGPLGVVAATEEVRHV